jgi:hypothetical protein
MEYYQLKEHLVISSTSLLFLPFFWKWAGGIPRLSSKDDRPDAYKIKRALTFSRKYATSLFFSRSSHWGKEA